MPIEVFSQIQVFDQEQFHARVKPVLRIVFDVHNAFGRLLNEELFKRAVAAGCVDAGMAPVEREVRVRVSQDGFTKDYRLDLLLCGGLLLEMKCAEALAPAHLSQTLHYLFLTGMQHALLVNVRTPRVEHRFVSTRLTPAERRRIAVEDSRWQNLGPESGTLRDRTLELLRDWGAFLDVSLYREALTFFLGGPQAVCRPVTVLSGKRELGSQTLHLLTPETGFAVTTVHESPGDFESHLQRFLNHTTLGHLQWINLNRHTVQCTTLTRPL